MFLTTITGVKRKNSKDYNSFARQIIITIYSDLGLSKCF